MAIIENEEEENQTFQIEKPSTNPLTGLRGFMSFHIMMHHFFFYSPLNLNLMGAVRTKNVNRKICSYSCFYFLTLG